MYQLCQKKVLRAVESYRISEAIQFQCEVLSLGISSALSSSCWGLFAKVARVLKIFSSELPCKSVLMVVDY